MSKSRRYKKYDPAIKAAIAMTGRIDLFPHLEIPRMTAKHWVQHGGDAIDDPITESMIEALNDLRIESLEVQKRLAEKDAIIRLLMETYQTLGFEIRWKHIDEPQKKIKILDAIETAMKTARRNACLSALGLSLSRYKRWRRERRGCSIENVKSCPRGNANQLTPKEILTMRELVTSKKFSHYPIRSLHFYAKREGLLVCSYSTWRKYIDHFKWKRPRKKHRKRKRKVGIRATQPNEIWHLDVSYFILPNKTKLYIQAIIDNYSRYVIAWQVMDSYDGSKTGELLKKAIGLTTNPSNKKLRLIVDGGGENRSKSVNKLEERGHFNKQVARFEISFSNSMVETLFRSLKHNYLFHQEIRSLTSLKKHVDFWFKEHNEKIPHTAFNGETPAEKFKNSWTEEKEIRILVRQQEAVKLRIKENQKIFCESCETA
ncbi:MAG: DDE-type integrase/transposase/recombinase [Bdellovibrionales bacterium]|nr:DDE-type integrase/transposase/recombinase [Bdellovibrionales bacterium]